MKAVVVFATITGNNENIANIVTEALQNHGIDVEENEMSMADVEDFEDADICVVCPYTYDEGALPDEGLDFYDDLNEFDLSGKTYGVAGSGDTAYGDDFCVAVDKFGKAFDKSGAVKGAENVHVNLAPDDSDKERLEQFVDELVNKAEQAIEIG